MSKRPDQTRKSLILKTLMDKLYVQIKEKADLLNNVFGFEATILLFLFIDSYFFIQYLNPIVLVCVRLCRE